MIIDYTGPFNYSRAINIAIPYVINEYTLIISSHTGLQNSRSAKEAIDAMVTNQQIAAVAFSSSTVGDIYFKETNQDNFDGWNGAWNTASIYRTELLKNRNFREDVKSAEDQEWSKWAIHEKSKIIWHAEGCNAVNLNPKKGSLLKTLSEWESVSKYTYPKYINTAFIAHKIYSAFSLLRKGKLYDFIIELGIAYILLRAWIQRFCQSSHHHRDSNIS